MIRGPTAWFGAALLTLSLVLPLDLIRGKSITGDEMSHIPAGYSYLVTRQIVLNPMHPPLIKEICAVPLLFLHLEMPADASAIAREGRDVTFQWKFGQDFFERNQPIERVVFWARVPAVLLSFCVALVILVWGTEVWGGAGGVLALFLYVFEPTVAAHAQLVTTDIALALFAAMFVYLLRRFLQSPSWLLVIACGIVLGLALGAKFSAVVLLPIAAILLATCGSKLTASTRVLALVPMLGIAYAVLWTIYFFPSDPFFYLQGMKTVEADFNPQALHFFMGELRHQSWYAYFLVAWLIKTPIPGILLVLAAILALARGERADWREEAFILVPLIVFFGGYSIAAPPLGIRYILPCYPFLFLFAGRLARAFPTRTTARKTFIAVCALWYVVEFAVIWPDHLPYFNQLAGGYRGGVAWLDDSNVDWGQGLIELRSYLQHKPAGDARLCYFGTIDPALYGLRTRPTWIDQLFAKPDSGTWILSSFCVSRVRAVLQARYGDGLRNWLAHIPPTAIVGHVYYVYDLGKVPCSITPSEGEESS